MLRCKTQGRGLDQELSGQFCEGILCELPVEGRRHALVVLLDCEAGEIIRGERLALDDGEVDLDLVEPTGVNRAVNGDQVGIGLSEALHAGCQGQSKFPQLCQLNFPHPG